LGVLLLSAVIAVV